MDFWTIAVLIYLTGMAASIITLRAYNRVYGKCGLDAGSSVILMFASWAAVLAITCVVVIDKAFKDDNCSVVKCSVVKFIEKMFCVKV